MTDQPFITVPIADALGRIEAKVDQIGNQMVTKADTQFVHELETRLRVVEVGMASTDAVRKALDRGRTAVWVAITAGATAVAGVAYVVIVVRGH